jgi:hypothetical protein
MEELNRAILFDRNLAGLPFNPTKKLLALKKNELFQNELFQNELFQNELFQKERTVPKKPT